MSAPHKFEMWICERCGVEGTTEATARLHYSHPAGWKREGNQHPETDRFDSDHPDKVKGFFWTVDWYPVALEAAHRYPEGHKRRIYWLQQAAEIAAERAESQERAGQNDAQAGAA